MQEIAIHGLGYVGLTAAVHYAKAGWKVLGFDPDPVVVDGIASGRPRSGEFLGYLDADVFALTRSRQLLASRSFANTIDYKVHSIAVPTERGGEPYDHIVLRVLEDLGLAIPDNGVIIVESTLTPGVIDRFLGANPKVYERIVKHEIALAVCPRRDWFADKSKNLATLDRIVGGVTDSCTQAAAAVLRTVTPQDRLHLTTYRTAEITKALENALLHVPVMFAHQLAYSLPHLDVAEALRLAGTHWRLSPLYLGFGTGGRCVPLGTQYLVNAAGEDKLTMGKLALELDGYQRNLIAHLVSKAGAKKVLVLGMAYRPNFRDMGLSPGLAVAHHLNRLGIEVEVHDPMWSVGELKAMTKLKVNGYTAPDLKDYDAVLLATPHKEYEFWPHENCWREGQIVLDGPGMWDMDRAQFMMRKVTYKRVGEPNWMTLKENA